MADTPIQLHGTSDEPPTWKAVLSKDNREALTALASAYGITEDEVAVFAVYDAHAAAKPPTVHPADVPEPSEMVIRTVLGFMPRIAQNRLIQLTRFFGLSVDATLNIAISDCADAKLASMRDAMGE